MTFACQSALKHDLVSLRTSGCNDRSRSKRAPRFLTDIVGEAVALPITKGSFVKEVESSRTPQAAFVGFNLIWVDFIHASVLEIYDGVVSRNGCLLPGQLTNILMSSAQRYDVRSGGIL